ncbi:GNAT family N-acetyltransferase [Tessaracoccus antarcticus]|uniref:GNAT family N-acetyltransferase n=1 Tax=Tessaracoccus antarcticus TaxID=2479848 RepID=A0A3M0G7N6_9ACTN|nr:GNAT family N-acetyltransferase [Tessaracoccus antarcticus]RMB60137.1 GNAT family N-acetyltransferase [Tessaracoccus antarcticus]
MHEPYRYEVLPLDTPDEDPRWAAYLDIFDFGFLDRRSADASVETYRTHRRRDRATLGMVTTVGPGLAGRQPVGAFASAPFTLNAGAGIVDCLVINTIAVSPSHRRRGLLTEMMRLHMGDARDRGLGCAVLSASEATIYGRYGFGVATRQMDLSIDTARFHVRDDVDVAEGHIEFVHPLFLQPHFDRITLAHQSRYRGAHGRVHGHYLLHTGAWDRADEGPSRSLRAAVHFDADGVPDGFAIFKHKGWESSPVTAEVVQVCSPHPSVDRALWRCLASIDLVERLTYGSSHPGDPLPLALKDPWSVKVTGGDDAVWLRLLDLAVATRQRGFDADGDVTFRVIDPLGWCEGTWRLRADGGRGTVERSDATPAITLGVDALATLWLGDRTAETLALAGRVTGDPDAIRAFSRVFATDLPPVNLARF